MTVIVCGSLNMDVVVQSARRPVPGETLLGATVSFLPGGKGLNQAVAAARLGVPTAMIGAVGNDAFANSLRGFLADNDIDCSGVREIDGPATGVALIQVAQKDNAITVASGVSLVSGILDYWPSSNPAEIKVLNANVIGGGTIATIDPSTLANGEYTIRLRGTLSNGTQQTSLIVITVTGENKPGRVIKTVTDLRVPVAGMPVTISRRYDSLERNKISDFGYGWALLTSVLRLNNGMSIDSLVTALETKGVLRRLAEPNLMALSGDAARFLAGGEFPVPIPNTTTNGFPTITIEYKKFGVELAFVPTVLSRGVINLRVEPSVSELDFTNAITIQGTTVPALTRRDARTTVELRDGQSFAIAGLLQTRNRQDVSQVPWIGSVPVLGTLFRSSSYQQQETDLVIIVTPRLVAPAVPGQQLASPLDSRLPANDVDFFLNGQMEVRKRYDDYVNSGGEVKGPYGHIIAPDVRLSSPPPAVLSDQPVVKTLN